MVGVGALGIEHTGQQSFDILVRFGSWMFLDVLSINHSTRVRLSFCDEVVVCLKPGWILLLFSVCCCLRPSLQRTWKWTLLHRRGAWSFHGPGPSTSTVRWREGSTFHCMFGAFVRCYCCLSLSGTACGVLIRTVLQHSNSEASRQKPNGQCFFQQNIRVYMEP